MRYVRGYDAPQGHITSLDTYLDGRQQMAFLDNPGE